MAKEQQPAGTVQAIDLSPLVNGFYAVIAKAATSTDVVLTALALTAITICDDHNLSRGDVVKYICDFPRRLQEEESDDASGSE